jgi:catechol 2,3-dioxygenase-like lactoylglutathione lyase family enzyme
MPVSGLLHVAIKTNDLEATVKFYQEVIGLVSVYRPPFQHRGAWLACPGSDAIVHIYAAGPGVGDGGPTGLGTTAIDHVSLTASGYHAYIKTFRERGIEWREFKVPNASLWQLFVFDPSGVQLELTFDEQVEAGPPPDMSDARRYKAGENFFRAPAATE